MNGHVDPFGDIDMQRYCQALFDEGTVPIAFADHDGLVRAVNDAYCAMVGRSRAEIVGTPADTFTHPDDLGPHAFAAERVTSDPLRARRTSRIEHRFVRPDGTIRWGCVSATSIGAPDGRQWTASVVQDTTDRRNAEDALRHAARTDSLTGLLNRRGWSDELSGSQLAPSGSSGPRYELVLAMIDFDRFKMYNDVHGHQGGDVLLVAFSTRARSILRGRGLIARWGGEEFALAFPRCNGATARIILEELAAAVPDGQTFSAGFTLVRPMESTVACLERADRLLYRAKQDGGGIARTG